MIVSELGECSHLNGAFSKNILLEPQIELWMPLNLDTLLNLVVSSNYKTGALFQLHYRLNRFLLIGLGNQPLNKWLVNKPLECKPFLNCKLQELNINESP